MVPVYQRMVRKLSSASKVPDETTSYPSVIRRTCDALIVGHGSSGLILQSRLQGAGVRALYVLDMRLQSDGTMPPHAFGYYESGDVGTMFDKQIIFVKPKTLVIATGRFETGNPLVNGDLPGVMLPEAVQQLISKGVRCGTRAVVVGANELRDRVVRELQAGGIDLVEEIPDYRKVRRLVGRTRVKAVETVDARILCDLVVNLGPLVPSTELASQAGCELKNREGFWVVKVDGKGRTSVPGIFACGGVAGHFTGEESIVSAEAAAASVLDYLRGG
jgi:hypothetical protein